MAVTTAQVGNLSISTQVVPAGESNVPGLSALPSTQNWTQALSQRKKQPVKALSAVIILIGALHLCLGVSMYVAESNYLSLVSRSGAFLISLVFISTGIITVVFANEESIFKIKTCLISHVINATSAAIGIVLYAIQVHTDAQTCWARMDSTSNRCIPASDSATSTPDYYGYGYFHYSFESYVFTLRVSLNALILFYIKVGLTISSCIIFLKWKSLKEARYTLLGN